MSETNKALVRRLMEGVMSRGEFQLADELVADDYVGHSSSPETEARGRDGYKNFFMGLRGAFPDLRIEIEDQIAEGDRVVNRWTATGTHQGDYFGLPASNRRGSVTGISIDRISNGRVVECWTNLDDLGLLRQIGAIPDPARAG